VYASAVSSVVMLKVRVVVLPILVTSPSKVAISWYWPGFWLRTMGQDAFPNMSVLPLQLWAPSLNLTLAFTIGTAGLTDASMSVAERFAWSLKWTLRSPLYNSVEGLGVRRQTPRPWVAT